MQQSVADYAKVESADLGSYAVTSYLIQTPLSRLKRIL